MPMPPQRDQPHTACDGQPMPAREKGPLFTFDASADLRRERFDSRSAWRLRRLEMR